MLTRSEIIASYKYILGRDVDEQGLSHYEDASTRGMTLDDLRSDLIKSEEFRKRFGSEASRTVKVGDVFVVVDANEPDFGSIIAQHGSWEPHIINIIRSHLSDGDTYIDIGGNVGVMALTAASIVGETGRVIAFEPHPENIRNFLEGIDANGFTNIKLHGFALSNEQMVFSLVGSSNGYLAPFGETSFQCISIAGDDVLLKEERIDFIKIDIEGHEPQALSGMKRTIAQHRPIILCEFNPRCLRDHIGCPPREFAAQLFGIANEITVVEHNDSRNIVSNAADLMSLWEAKNRYAVESGHLPDGMLHFDLLFRTDDKI